MLSYNGDPSSTLARVADLDRAEYNSVYRPINREMIASTNSTDLVNSAKSTANTNFDTSQARQTEDG